MRTSKGQAWSLDYTIGMLLFFFAIIIGLTIIINIFKNQDYDKLYQNAEIVSDLFASPGYPEDWDNESVYQIGLLTEGRINKTKMEYLYAMQPNSARKYLKTRYNYYLFLEDPAYGILYQNMTCGFGDYGPVPDGPITYSTVAYYFSQLTEGTLLPIMKQTYHADVYVRDQEPGGIVKDNVINGSLDNLSTQIHRYDTIILENPGFNLFTGESDSTSLKILFENWVSEGNTLILIGGVGLTGFLEADFPEIEEGIGNATIQIQDDLFAFSPSESTLLGRKYTIDPTGGIDEFIMIANYTNDEYGIGHWKYGEGTVIYYGDVLGTYNDQNNLSRPINHSITRTALGFCQGINITSLEYDNMATLQRYVVHNNKIMKMHIYLWE